MTGGNQDFYHVTNADMQDALAASVALREMMKNEAYDTGKPTFETAMQKVRL